MRVIYNGVDLFALETHEFFAEPVYDDSVTDYLYTKYSLVVTAVVNGLVSTTPVNGPFMSYQFEGGLVGPVPGPFRTPSLARGAIGAGLGDGIDVGATTALPRNVIFAPSTGPVTHQAVRHRLTTPRAPLFVFAGGGFEVGNPAGGLATPSAPLAEMILSSPPAQTICDCKNGPIPRVMGITAAMGDAATFLVDFAVETYINESTENNVRPNSMLLSNRWKQSHSIDRAGYTTITTDGLAIFRTDEVYRLNTSPDVSRPILFMPIPQGFVREIDAVDGREDVTGVAYRYRDIQVPVNFVSGPTVGAADISAVHRQSVTSDVNLFGRILEIYQTASNILLNNKWLRAKDGGSSRPPRGGGPLPGRLMVPGGRTS